MGSVVELPSPSIEDLPLASRARLALDMNMRRMSDETGIPYSTLRAWEQKKLELHKEPSGAAKTLLELCCAKPEAMKELFRERNERNAAA